MPTVMRQLTLLLAACLPVWGLPAIGYTPPDDANGSFNFKLPPISLGQIRKLVRDAPDETVSAELGRRGIDFRPTFEIIDELKAVGARRLTLDILRAWMSNRPPTLILNSGKPEIDQGEKFTVFADASDPDEDRLEYSWSSTQGTVANEGKVGTLDTSYIALEQDEVEVTISVSVADRKGGVASASKTVRVRQQPSIKSWREDEYILVSLAGAHPQAPGKRGALEVEVGPAGTPTETLYVTGKLPGLPCRIDLVAQGDNIAEFYLKEGPGVSNGWRKILIGVRPRDPRRAVRFAVNWQLLETTQWQ
jgi:hypothetical protein